MITNEGKQLVAKFLLDQAPAYASFIAAGIGAKPLLQEDSVELSPTQKSLEFESFRVPIASKGFIKEDGIEKIVFKSEMPTDQRYQITELGVYPAVNNSVAGKFDSKLLLTFSPSEQWQYVFEGSASAVPYPNEALDDDNELANINSTIEDVLFINSDSTMFNTQLRRNRYEPPRFLNRALMVSGSTSFLSSSFTLSGSPTYIENSNISFDLSGNLPDDEIRLALSLVSKTASENSNPTTVRILIELINNLSGLTIEAPKAVARISLSDSDFKDDEDNVNRYIVIKRKLSQFIKDANFSFANVNNVRIFTSVLSGGSPTSDYYIVYDGLKLENLTSENPLYTLFAYNVIKTDDGLPILKKENTSNYIEYRFGIGVDG
jgi:hypothetical protein